jgi:hypothetical protein
MQLLSVLLRQALLLLLVLPLKGGLLICPGLPQVQPLLGHACSLAHQCLPHICHLLLQRDLHTTTTHLDNIKENDMLPLLQHGAQVMHHPSCLP